MRRTGKIRDILGEARVASRDRVLADMREGGSRYAKGDMETGGPERLDSARTRMEQASD